MEADVEATPDAGATSNNRYCCSNACVVLAIHWLNAACELLLALLLLVDEVLVGRTISAGARSASQCSRLRVSLGALCDVLSERLVTGSKYVNLLAAVAKRRSGSGRGVTGWRKISRIGSSWVVAGGGTVWVDTPA